MQVFSSSLAFDSALQNSDRDLGTHWQLDFSAQLHPGAPSSAAGYSEGNVHKKGPRDVLILNKDFLVLVWRWHIWSLGLKMRGIRVYLITEEDSCIYEKMVFVPHILLAKVQLRKCYSQ